MSKQVAQELTARQRDALRPFLERYVAVQTELAQALNLIREDDDTDFDIELMAFTRKVETDGLTG